VKNSLKLLTAAVILTLSTTAYAMPAQVPDRWYDQREFVFEVITGNPGFCRFGLSSRMCPSIDL